MPFIPLAWWLGGGAAAGGLGLWWLSDEGAASEAEEAADDQGVDRYLPPWWGWLGAVLILAMLYTLAKAGSKNSVAGQIVDSLRAFGAWLASWIPSVRFGG